MSAAKFGDEPMTKREVLIARDKFVMGVHWMYQRKAVPSEAWPGDDIIRDTAAQLYPLPKVTRPRVVGDSESRSSNVYWMVSDGYIVRANARGEVLGRFMSEKSSDWAPLPDRVALWADLLANPTEEVEE